MLRLEVTPGRLAGHRRIRAIRRPIPASAGSSPAVGRRRVQTLPEGGAAWPLRHSLRAGV